MRKAEQDKRDSASRTCTERNVHTQGMLLCAVNSELLRMSSMLEACSSLQDTWAMMANPPPGVMPALDRSRFGAIERCTQAAPSLRQGLGVHASCFLPAASVATLYPVNAIGDASHRLTLNRDDEMYFKGTTARPYRLEPWHPAIKAWSSSLWIDANPERAPRAGWLGHLVNDAAVCSGGSDAEISSYYQAPTNCVMVPFGRVAPIMAVFTTRDVDEGEELLLACESAAVSSTDKRERRDMREKRAQEVPLLL